MTKKTPDDPLGDVLHYICIGTLLMLAVSLAIAIVGIGGENGMAAFAIVIVIVFGVIQGAKGMRN